MERRRPPAPVVLFAGLVLAVVPPAAAEVDGGIVFPPDGACFGPDEAPVVVEDDFDAGPGNPLSRSYAPTPRLVERLLAADVSLYARFGEAVALSEGVALVGAPRDDRFGRFRSGSAHVFDLGQGGWSATADLPPIEHQPHSEFGEAVAIDGDWAAVGHPRWNWRSTDDGVVGLYRREPDGGWSPPFWLTSGNYGLDSYVRFGASVSIDGGRVVVGAPGQDAGGRAHVFDASSKRRIVTLHAADSPTRGQFGSAVDVDDDRVLVGARFHHDPVSYAGAAYVFHEHAFERYRLEAKLTPPHPTYEGYFGHAVAIDGDLAVVGEPAFEAYGLPGSAHVFRRVGAAWTHEATLAAPGLDRNDSFGRSVAVHDGSIWVGAPIMDAGERLHGAVFEFRKDEEDWVAVRRLTAERSEWFFRFGQSVDAGEQGVVVGVPVDLVGSETPGSAYVFRPAASGGLPAYRLHGDHVVRVEARAPDGATARDEVRFTIDRIPPRVEILLPYWDDILVEDTPFDIVFRSSDDDVATGDVTHEVVRMNGCEIFDGDRFGNGDGLLRDETLRVGAAQRCRIARECGFDVLEEVRIEVVVTDCGGNDRTREIRRRGGPLRLYTDDCR